jgi:recombination protein RecA
MPRARLDDDFTPEDIQHGGNYFADQKAPVDFVSTGCALLDCTLGGGWPLTRISNVVGDESTGKTLLAIEAFANFNRQFPRGKMYYREAESAFDETYASALGMPVEQVDISAPDEIETVEDWHNDLMTCIDECKTLDVPGFYVLDSLDGLTDKAEQKEKFDAATYGTSKAKMIGKSLRMSKKALASANMHLLIISQTRDKIGATIPTKTRAGGRALDFFASQCLWLSHADDVIRQIRGVRRVTGIHIKARCKKNKIALPYRRCEFTISFGHGIDSLVSDLDWLEGSGYWDDVFDAKRPTIKKRLDAMSNREYWEETKRVDKEVTRIWRDIEDGFLADVRPKYREDA